jgi:hypothetical protein
LPRADWVELDGIINLNQSSFRFSTRDLLIGTTIVSIVLGAGVWLGGILILAVVISLVQAITLLAGDWLIRPENQRALAFTTALSWVMLGSGLLVLAIRAIGEAIDPSNEWMRLSMLGCISAVGAVASYLMARHRWRQLGDQGRENL